ncbi:hypothetical protein F444_18705 [Phytophthora nicotianae P1976]|uniref:Uncharacterized protein n=1 Tax=Phytophthora nicotianae P1976 TaxID=1317066 RepID=A0A080ZAH3_PHYNI|nr:hypothetical protein F444_18705 [Phytophthora nicotianae P1976]
MTRDSHYEPDRLGRLHVRRPLQTYTGYSWVNNRPWGGLSPLFVFHTISPVVSRWMKFKMQPAYTYAHAYGEA